MTRKEFLRDGDLARVFVCDADLFAGRQQQAVQLSAVGRSTRIRCNAQVAIHPWRSRFSRDVEFFRPDEGKNVVFMASSRMSLR